MCWRGWLSTGRHHGIRPGRWHEGQLCVAELNRRWASDITGIRAWDSRKGRLAIMIDCADRMVLVWRFATRITAEDLAEMLREAMFRQFGEARTHARGSSSSATMGRNTPRIGSGRRAGHGAHLLPHAPAESGVARLGGGLLWQLQAGLVCIRRASTRWKRWGVSCRLGSNTTTGRRRTAPWKCSRQPSSMRTG